VRSGQEIELSLKEWLDENLPAFLNRINAEIQSEQPWEMPVVEDYALVVSVKDFKDGLGGVFVITDANVAAYRIRGLIAEALNS